MKEGKIFRNQRRTDEQKAATRGGENDDGAAPEAERQSRRPRKLTEEGLEALSKKDRGADEAKADTLPLLITRAHQQF